MSQPIFELDHFTAWVLLIPGLKVLAHPEMKGHSWKGCMPTDQKERLSRRPRDQTFEPLSFWAFFLDNLIMLIFLVPKSKRYINGRSTLSHFSCGILKNPGIAHHDQWEWRWFLRWRKWSAARRPAGSSRNDPPWKVSSRRFHVVPKFKMPAKHVCSTWHLWRLSMLCKIQWSWMELVPKRSRRVGGSDYHVQLLSVQWTSSRHNMNTLYTFSKCLMNLCKIIYSSLAADHDGARPLSQASTSTGPSKCNKKKIYLVGEAQGKESQETGLRAQGCQFLEPVVF